MARPETPTKEMRAKLPAWARNYMEQIERERETAIKTLNRFKDEQKPSMIYYDAWECLGENGESGPTTQRRYLQTTRIKLSFDPHNEGSDINMETEISIHPDKKRIEVRCPRGYPLIEPAGNNLFYIVEKPDWRTA